MYFENYRNWLVVILVCFFTLTLFQCDVPPRGKGPEDVVYIFAPGNTDETIRTMVDSVFKAVIYTPASQRLYQTKWMKERDIPKFKYFKNLLVIADLNRTSITQNLVEKILPDNQYQSALLNKNCVFIRQNIWARGQTLCIIAGTDMDTLAHAVIQNKTWIFSQYDLGFRYRYKHFVMDEYEQKMKTRKLMDTYGWSFRVQNDYMFADEYPAQHFVRLVRGFPARWVSIYWEEGEHPHWMTLEGAVQVRNEIGKRFYDNIYTEDKFLRLSYVSFNDFTALRLRGLWASSTETKGGPFISYVFYDIKTNRTFYIDILVFGPGEKLTTILRQTEIMVRTFTTAQTAG